MSTNSQMKKRNKKSSPVAGNSFANMVANTANKQMETFVEQKVQQYSQLVLQKISTLVLDHLANIQTRHLALEAILVEAGTVTREKINLEITNQEDTALGFESVESAKEGDLIRIEVESKEEGASDWEPSEKLRINNLMRKVEGRVQTLEELESALIGSMPNEVKEVMLPISSEQGKSSTLRVRVVKISRKKEGEKSGT